METNKHEFICMIITKNDWRSRLRVAYLQIGVVVFFPYASTSQSIRNTGGDCLTLLQIVFSPANSQEIRKEK